MKYTSLSLRFTQWRRWNTMQQNTPSWGQLWINPLLWTNISQKLMDQHWSKVKTLLEEENTPPWNQSMPTTNCCYKVVISRKYGRKTISKKGDTLSSKQYGNTLLPNFGFGVCEIRKHWLLPNISLNALLLLFQV